MASGLLKSAYNQCEATQEIGVAGQYIPPTKRQRLDQAKAQLEAHLAKINAAIEALDKYPELEGFINVLESAGV